MKIIINIQAYSDIGKRLGKTKTLRIEDKGRKSSSAIMKVLIDSIKKQVEEYESKNNGVKHKPIEQFVQSEKLVDRVQSKKTA